MIGAPQNYYVFYCSSRFSKNMNQTLFFFTLLFVPRFLTLYLGNLVDNTYLEGPMYVSIFVYGLAVILLKKEVTFCHFLQGEIEACTKIHFINIIFELVERRNRHFNIPHQKK